MATGMLQGKVALVTGAGSGIGRGCALKMAREGAKVVVCDVVVSGGEETVKMIKKAGGEAIFVKVDVTKAAEVEAMVKTAVDTYGRLDCAHNNAGIGAAARKTADISEAVFDRCIAVDLKSVWLCMKYEIPQMLKQGKGSIVNTASTLGLVGMIERSEYAAAKHGVVGLTKVAALDYATAGIRVNGVAPGVIQTPLVDAIWARDPKSKEMAISSEPVGRPGTVEEIAEGVTWLLSDAASFVTGHILAIDGGWVTR